MGAEDLAKARPDGLGVGMLWIGREFKMPIDVRSTAYFYTVHVHLGFNSNYLVTGGLYCSF